MRGLLRTDVRVDLLNSTADIAGTAKLAAKFGAYFDLTPPQSTDEHGYVARTFREQPAWLKRELALLVLVQAMTDGKSVDSVFDALRADLERMHVTMDKPLSDVAGIGDAPPANEPD